MVDAIGGIRLAFPYPVRDHDHNNSGLAVATPGCRHLDGSQALALARDDTLTLGEAVRLAVQFHAFRPDTLVGLTIPTVPALGRGDVVLRPGQPGFQQAWAEGGWEQILLPVRPATRQTVARFLGRSGPAHPSRSTPGRPAPPEPWDPRPC